MKIAIGSDHGGFEYKKYLMEKVKGIEFVDVGAYELNPEDDYTDFSFKIAEMVSSGEVERGIMICRTGVGAIIAMNKVKGVLAGLCEGVPDVALAREKNNINCLSFGADNISKAKAKAITEAFILTSFEGGRHERRVNKILAYEKQN
jgi:ribose 5-phosphate isomerase B